jgi:hypothetical protein
MAYPNGDIDWTQPIKAFDQALNLGQAQNEAAEANNNAWAWRRHAEALNQRFLKALKDGHEILNQRDAWRATAKELVIRFTGDFADKSREEVFQIYDQNKAEIFAKNPYTGPEPS